jgi:hypothetical protein
MNIFFATKVTAQLKNYNMFKITTDRQKIDLAKREAI